MKGWSRCRPEETRARLEALWLEIEPAIRDRKYIRRLKEGR